ncbi:MAG: gluconate:H+ symporter [Anaerovibrio sp.]|nr:gluconate:H+ symporter [Anaerovibrio sp.]
MVTGFPLLIAFVVSVAILLVLIIKFKVNPFIALIFSSIVTAFGVNMPMAEIPKVICAGFGGTLTGIGIVIGLGIIFGNLLYEAGATEAIAKGLLKATGKNNAALAVTTAGFLISIPVFMDAAFVIMMPIVKYVAKETKKSVMMFVCALGVGTIVGHAMVIPTPGPLAVAANMNAEIGGFLLYSLIAGFCAIAVAGWLYGKRFSSYPAYEGEAEDPLTDSRRLPSFGLSMATLLFPIVLILLSNVVMSVCGKEDLIYQIFAFAGEKDIALFLGCIVAFIALRSYQVKSFNTMVTEAADSAGLILLITGAGGAFGKVLSTSGIGDYLVTSMSDMNVSPIVLGFVLSAVLRASQGSTTVALVTTSSILGTAIAGTGVSPVLVGLAICAGGIGFSLPNDSGFWVLSRFSGITVSETIQSWTIGGTIASFTVFIVIMIIAAINNVVPLPFL